MLRKVLFALMGLVAALLIIGVLGWTTIVKPLMDKLMPGMFDIEYTTSMDLVRVPLRGLESEDPVALVVMPAAYVPSATSRTGNSPTSILPVVMSWPTLGPATEADSTGRVVVNPSHINPVYMAVGCEASLYTAEFQHQLALPLTTPRRGTYYQVDPAMLGGGKQFNAAYIYLDRQPANSLISLCERGKCTAMMYLGAGICGALSVPPEQFDQVLDVGVLFTLREKMRGYMAVRRSSAPMVQPVPPDQPPQ